MGEPEASRGVEGVRDRETVVDGAKHDRPCPSSRGNDREVETNAPCPEVEPGDHIGEPKASRDVEGDWSRESDGDGVGYHGRRDGKDGATSSARCDSKRVERRPLATEEARQQRRYRQCVKNVPRSSMAPSKHPRHPIELPNSPRRRGRMKSRPRKVNRTKTKESTHRIVRPRRGQIRRIKRIGDVAYESRCWGSLSRQDTGAARHCRGRGYKIARTQHYPSRDLPYMDTARRSRTRTLDSSHRSFNINSFHWN